MPVPMIKHSATQATESPTSIQGKRRRAMSHLGVGPVGRGREPSWLR